MPRVPNSATPLFLSMVFNRNERLVLRELANGHSATDIAERWKWQCRPSAGICALPSGRPGCRIDINYSSSFFRLPGAYSKAAGSRQVCTIKPRASAPVAETWPPWTRPPWTMFLQFGKWSIWPEVPLQAFPAPWRACLIFRVGDGSDVASRTAMELSWPVLKPPAAISL